MCREGEWRRAVAKGAYEGSSQDLTDGFIHFSTAQQLYVSAAKHRSGQEGLVLLSVDVDRIPGDILKWEASRGGQLFPHLYGTLSVDAVVRVDAIPLDSDGVHVFPTDLNIPGFVAS